MADSETKPQENDTDGIRGLAQAYVNATTSWKEAADAANRAIEVRNALKHKGDHYLKQLRKSVSRERPVRVVKLDQTRVLVVRFLSGMPSHCTNAVVEIVNEE